MWYRIYLTVRDSGGLTHTTQRDILPRKVVLTLATNPAGLQLKLDGQPVATPLSFDAVVGMARTIEATTPQSSGPTTYTFASWSDGGAASHSISTPATNTTYTATYQASGSTGPPIALVQHAGKDAGTTTSSSLAFPSNNTAGNWIAVAIRAGRDGPDVHGHATRAAIRIAKRSSSTRPSTPRRWRIFYAENIAGGANTVTVSELILAARCASRSSSMRGWRPSNSLDVTATRAGHQRAPTTARPRRRRRVATW